MSDEQDKVMSDEELVAMVSGTDEGSNETVETESPQNDVDVAADEKIETQDTAKDDVSDTSAEASKSTSKSWAEIAKAERKNQQERAALKKLRLDVENERKKIEDIGGKSVDFKKKVQEDPFGALQEVGIKFEDLARAVLDGKKGTVKAPQPPQDNSEVKALREELQNLKNSIQQQNTGNTEAAVQNNIVKTLQKDEFKLLNTYPDAAGEVWQYVLMTVRETGELPDIENGYLVEASAKILQDVWREHLVGLKDNPEIVNIFGLGEVTKEEIVGKESKAPESKPKTLTNRMAATTKRGEDDLPSFSSEEEELAEAAKLIPKDTWDRLGG